MFKKRGFLEISVPDPSFYVRYLGKVETKQPKGRGCTREPVMRIWEKTKHDLRHAQRSCLTVNLEGLRLQNLEKKKGGQNVLFRIESVSFCMAERELPKVFTWIVRSADTQLLECHAVYCSQAKAQALAIVLSRAFAVAFRDWKFDRKRQARSMQRGKREQIAKFISEANELSADTAFLDGHDETDTPPHLPGDHHHSDGSGCSSCRSEGDTDSIGVVGNNLADFEGNAEVQALIRGDQVAHWDDLGSEPGSPLTPTLEGIGGRPAFDH